MKYMIAIETTQYVEVEAETEDAAIESVKNKLDPRVAAAAHYEIIKEPTFDKESGSYKLL